MFRDEKESQGRQSPSKSCKEKKWPINAVKGKRKDSIISIGFAFSGGVRIASSRAALSSTWV
jgi:hypothetical protein